MFKEIQIEQRIAEYISVSPRRKVGIQAKYFHINTPINEFDLLKINKIIGGNWGSKQPNLRHPHLPPCYFYAKKEPFQANLT